MKLYSYFRSGAAWRVRIALNLKGLQVDYVPVDLLDGGQSQPGFLAVNPQGLVPALELDGGEVLTQSPAIIEWLDETHPEPPLLPADALGRARVRALVAMIDCDIHPLSNLRVVRYLREAFGADSAAVKRWASTWISAGFDAYEARLAADASRGLFSHGDAPTLADIHLMPQIESARMFKVDLARWPRILAVEAACMELPAFRDARPQQQPDAPAP
jgi:maleylpyruvate isomerase